ncbi:MAG: sigma-70 family RNA polymerase sigma factor [Planctomycetota bacterium]|nr:sigma-70 family RNA polymerase sigma factor [Planctomycetota bacterium]
MNPFSTFSSSLNPETRALLKRAKDGDNSAYNDLFERHKNRLRFYIEVRLGKKLRSEIEANDIVQETFLQAHRSFDAFENNDQSSFLAWLYRIADNRMRDIAGHMNAQKRRPDAPVLRGTEIAMQIRDQHRGPATEAAQGEEQSHLLEALDDLDSDLKELILLHFLSELSYQQIADQLNVPKTTIRRQIAKASIQLGGLLKKLNKPR